MSDERVNKMIDSPFLPESTIWNKKLDYQTIDAKKELMASSDYERRLSADFILRAMFWGSKSLTITLY